MVLAQLAALKTTSTADLKAQWRKLNDTEPPPYNRRFLESRLAYRIQELAFGGLKPVTVKKLEALGEQIDGRRSGKRKPRMDAKAGRSIGPSRLFKADGDHRARLRGRVPGTRQLQRRNRHRRQLRSGHFGG